MGYLGNPIVQGNFSQIDDLSGSFDSSTTQFTIQVGSDTQIIGALTQLLIHINGVYQVLALRLHRIKLGAIAFTGSAWRCIQWYYIW